MTFGVSRSTESTISRTVGAGFWTVNADDDDDDDDGANEVRVTALLAAKPLAPGTPPNADDDDAKSDTLFKTDNEVGADEDSDDADAVCVSISG